MLSHWQFSSCGLDQRQNTESFSCLSTCSHHCLLWSKSADEFVKRSKIEQHKSSEKIPVQPDEFWYIGLEITFRKNPTNLLEVNKDRRKSQKTMRSCWTAGSVQKFTVLPAAGSDWGRITTITANELVWKLAWSLFWCKPEFDCRARTFPHKPQQGSAIQPN